VKSEVMVRRPAFWHNTFMKTLKLNQFCRKLACIVIAVFVMANATQAHQADFNAPEPVSAVSEPVYLVHVLQLADGLDSPSELKCCSKSEDANSSAQKRCMSDLTVMGNAIHIRSVPSTGAPDAAMAVRLHGIFHPSLLRPPIAH